MKDAPKEDPKIEVETAEEIIQRVLKLFDITGSIEIRRRKEGTILDIQGCNNPGRLIGESGNTLRALQHLVTLIVCRKIEKPTDIIIDVNGYRERRREQLEDTAWRAFDRVIRTGKSVVLRPMNSADRRIIHATLGNEPDIETFSIDEDPETGTKCVQISLRASGDYERDVYPEDEIYEDEILEEDNYSEGDFEEPFEEDPKN